MITITNSNDGSAVISTTYWSTDHARAGLLYLSINAGAVRILVPRSATTLLADLPPVGTEVELRRRVEGERTMLQILYLDIPTEPYEVAIDQRQSDRWIAAEDLGRVLPLIWYGEGEGEGVVEVRRETIAVVR